MSGIMTWFGRAGHSARIETRAKKQGAQKKEDDRERRRKKQGGHASIIVRSHKRKGRDEDDCDGGDNTIPLCYTRKMMRDEMAKSAKKVASTSTHRGRQKEPDDCWIRWE